uniref:RluA family pseudouridine synthase n=1 Tax=Acetatifactor sp. TaxID=1872090 RepID=UPI0040566094
MRTKIIYEDKYIIIAHKPAGLATQTAKVGQRDMVSELKNYLAREQKRKEPYLAVIHRLDQPVEGLLVFAKEKQAAAVLTKQLSEGTLNKRYYAVICGKPSGKSDELVDYIYKESDNRAQIVTGNQNRYQEAKKAVLHYRVLKELSAEKEIYVVDIHIDTGRFHQIRAQMSHAGMPLLGDNKYGNEKSLLLSRELGIRNVALCAYVLEVAHPVTGKILSYAVEPENPAFYSE